MQKPISLASFPVLILYSSNATGSIMMPCCIAWVVGVSTISPDNRSAISSSMNVKLFDLKMFAHHEPVMTPKRISNHSRDLCSTFLIFMFLDLLFCLILQYRAIVKSSNHRPPHDMLRPTRCRESFVRPLP